MDFKRFSQFIAESYVNALPGQDELKHKYMDQVWDVLQRSYKSIGGIKGSGFASPDDMHNIPMWKMNVVDGKVVAVVMYKDKGGRKSVAMGTDGSEVGNSKIVDMLKSDLKRSYGEKSKAALGATLKLYPEDVIKQFLIPPHQVAKLSKDEIIPVSSLGDRDIPEDGLKTLARYPYIRDYAYMREIGGKMIFKVMLGTPGKTIK